MSNTKTATRTNDWKRKQQWIENVMASRLSNATKVFAFAFFSFAYGSKTTSYPGSNSIKEAGGFTSHGHFTEYRTALQNCGAVTISKKRASRFAQEHSVYELNLNWDGKVPQGDELSIPQALTSDGTLGDVASTSGDGAGTGSGSNPSKNSSRKTSIDEIQIEKVAEHDQVQKDKALSDLSIKCSNLSNQPSLEHVLGDAARPTSDPSFARAKRISGHAPPSCADYRTEQQFLEAFGQYYRSSRAKTGTPHDRLLANKSNAELKTSGESLWRTHQFRLRPSPTSSPFVRTSGGPR